MSTNDRRAWRQIDTGDPDEHDRLHLAWENFELMLNKGGHISSDLDFEDLDYVIADLMAVRHRVLARIAPDDTVRTTFTQREGVLTLDSHAIDGAGVERSLSFRDLDEEVLDGPGQQPG